MNAPRPNCESGRSHVDGRAAAGDQLPPIAAEAGAVVVGVPLAHQPGRHQRVQICDPHADLRNQLEAVLGREGPALDARGDIEHTQRQKLGRLS
jgi:hypothetical protein